MASAVERLMGLMGAQDCYDIEPVDLLLLQIEAANERLSSQIDKIGLLKNRAES